MIEELVDVNEKGNKNFAWIDEDLSCSLPSGEVSKDWTQGKNILSFIEISSERMLVGSRSHGLHA